MTSKQGESRVGSYADNIRRIRAGECELKVYKTKKRHIASQLQRSDQAMLADAYLDLGKRRIDEYAIEADGVLWVGSSTANLDTAKERLAAFVADDYEDAKIVRVVTFTQEVDDQSTNGE